MKKLIFLIIVIATLGLSPLLLGNYRPTADFTDQQIPFLFELKRMLASGTPWWSWNTFIGDNFIGGYSFYTLTSPFAWFIAMFPRDMVLVGVVVALYLKMIAAGCSAYAYIKRMGYEPDSCVVGGLCYVFSTFFTTNLFYYHFCEPIIVFPLLLISIENVFESRRYGVTQLALTSFAVLWINYYFAIPSFLLGLIYAVIRYTCHFRRLKTVKVGRIIIMAFVGILEGVLLASVVLLPTALHVIGSGRSDFNFFIESDLKMISIVLFENIRAIFMPEIAEGVPGAFIWSGCTSTEAFIPVIGLFPLLCMLKYRREIVESEWLIPLFVTLIVLYLTPLNDVFSLFTNIGYTRWLYGFTLFMSLAFVSCISRNRITTKNYWTYVVLSVVLMFMLMAYFFYRKRGTHYSLNHREWVELGLWLVNLILLGIYVCRAQTNGGFIKLFSVSAAIQLAFVVGVIFYCGSNKGTVTYFKAMQRGNLPYSSESFHYRTDFNSQYSNCGLMENLPSIESFHSVSNKRFDDFRVLISDNRSCPTMFIRHNRVSVDALLSVKDIIDYRSESSENEPIDSAAILLAQKGDLSDRYAFKYYIPMGFSYDSYITREEFNKYLKTDPADTVLPLLENLVINSEDVSALGKYLKHGEIRPDATLDSIVSERRKNVAASFVGDTRGLKMTTNFDEDRVVFISVVSDPGFKATIDNQDTPIYSVNLGMSAIVVPQGKHFIDFDYTPPGLRHGALLSIIAIIILIVIAAYERRAPRPKNAFDI